MGSVAHVIRFSAPAAKLIAVGMIRHVVVSMEQRASICTRQKDKYTRETKGAQNGLFVNSSEWSEVV